MFSCTVETGPLLMNLDHKSDPLEVTGGRVEGWATTELDGPPGKALAPTPAKPMHAKGPVRRMIRTVRGMGYMIVADP